MKILLSENILHEQIDITEEIKLDMLQNEKRYNFKFVNLPIFLDKNNELKVVETSELDDIDDTIVQDLIDGDKENFLEKIRNSLYKHFKNVILPRKMEDISEILKCIYAVNYLKEKRYQIYIYQILITSLNKLRTLNISVRSTFSK